MSHSEYDEYSDSETELEDFMDELRFMIKNKADNTEILEHITDALQGKYSAGILNDLVEITAARDVSKIVDHKIEELRDQTEKEVEIRLEIENEQERNELQEKYDNLVLYDLAEKKLISDPDFRNQMLNKLRTDLIKSKENGNFPKLLELTLENCDEDLIFNQLLNNFKEELLERYKISIMQELKYEYEEELMQEIKSALYNDEQFIDNVKEQVMKELAQKIFE